MCVRWLTVLLASAIWLQASEAPPYRLTVVRSVEASEASRTKLSELNTAVLELSAPATDSRGETTRREQWLAQERARLRIRELGLNFLRDRPDDPLRWVAVQQMVLSAPLFLTGFKDGFDDTQGRARDLIEVDEGAAASWRAQLERWKSQLGTAPDVPWEVRERQAYLALTFEVGDAILTGPRGWGPMERRIEQHAALFPEGTTAWDLYRRLYREKISAGGAPAEELWGRLSTSASQTVREQARAQLEKIDRARAPLDMVFTAVDGREVDLSKLRGKVVLVDFWATWCGPCIAELPTLKKVYAEYHERGFEIVGIALENAQLKPGDTREQIAAKLERARKVLTDFMAKEAMPWPQYFDGKWWKTDLAVRHEVNAIPAMFLLDREGRVVTNNVRGEKLEAEVKRLLGL